MIRRKTSLVTALVIGLMFTCGSPPMARADTATLTLTPAGTGLGFTLNTVVDGFGQIGGCCGGPLGNAVNSDGDIIVQSSFIAAKNYVFNDVNNQTLASAISSTSFTGFPPAFSASNGSVWGSDAGQLIKLNNDGSTNTTYSVQGLSISNGMWTNPTNGHLIAAGNGNLYDIDVSGGSPTFKIITTAVFADGVSVSPDGKTVYAAVAGGVIGYDIKTGTVVLPFQSVDGADGMGVITSTNASINGQLIVNTNSGDLVMVDPKSFAQVIIASGGSRGDYVSADPNGSLLVTQSDELMRLSCGEGCSIGGPAPTVPTVPEPSSLLLLGSGLAALAGFKRRNLLNLTH